MNRLTYYIHLPSEENHIHDTLEMIIGICPISFISINEVADFLQTIKNTKILLLIGQCNASFISSLQEQTSKADEIFLITGVNLSMLLEVSISLGNQNISFEEIVTSVEAVGKESVQRLN